MHTIAEIAGRAAAGLTRSARIAAPALVAALAACDGGPTDPQPSAGASTVRFAYEGSGAEGVVSGAYEATGDPRAGQSRQTFAIGQRYRGAGAIQVVSDLQRPGDVSDFAWVVIPRLDAGTLAIDRACGTDYCPGVFFALEVKNTHGSQARYSCTLESGTVRVTSISATRVAGEFSGTGACIGAPGTADLEQVSVAGGRFDVKLIDAQT